MRGTVTQEQSRLKLIEILNTNPCGCCGSKSVLESSSDFGFARILECSGCGKKLEMDYTEFNPALVAAWWTFEMKEFKRHSLTIV